LPSGIGYNGRVPTVSCASALGPDAEHYLLERYAGNHRRSWALRAFYGIKPLIPRGVQLAMRRRYAKRQARRPFPAWPAEPILVERQHEQLRRRVRTEPSSRVPIVNFWPDRRRFALILTHDVEGPAGVENIPAVRQVEQRHGLVSSWNFVAEGYPLPDGLFDELRASGCEVGLHGIRHDGKLFSSRASFDAELPKIHHYLQAWGAEGFRSPATHRNADWMPELGCRYDSSFPDTDPFEPQAGGCCSIFPFFIGPMVELPITLVQDHTLLDVLGQASTALWIDKAHWLIERHGLINIIIHPDYMLTPDRLGLYDRFLAYLRQRIDRDDGWHALPREVAQWWRLRAALCDRIEGQEVSALPEPLPNGATLAEAAEMNGRIVFDLAPRSQRVPLARRPARLRSDEQG
jgi:hypothetical protein